MRILRNLLLPFALLYGGITWTRNMLYNSRILKSTSYDLPVICVGNLNVGGTGKSPMIEYLLNLLNRRAVVASLSRGYKRSSKGFQLLSGSETAREVGDEPLQFKRKFENVLVAVDADRRNGIQKLIRKGAEVILLDDAFQHRKVKAGFNILLTAYGDLYVNDFMLPTGNLREPTVGAERAELVVVTKCPPNLTQKEQDRIQSRLRLQNYQKLFFTYISYAEKALNDSAEIPVEELRNQKFSLVTGIANPKPLLDHLEKLQLDFTHFQFPDHHNFSPSELEKLQKEELLLTTEKDYVRLKNHLPQEKLFYLPIKVDFLKGKRNFDTAILKYINEK